MTWKITFYSEKVEQQTLALPPGILANLLRIMLPRLSEQTTRCSVAIREDRGSRLVCEALGHKM